MNIIETSQLTKKFGEFTALDEIDISVNSKEIVGLIGPNGSGKTTMIKLFCSLHFPTKGIIKIFDMDISKNDSYKERLAYMAENAGYYEDMTAYNYLRFFSKYYMVPNTDDALQHVLEKVGLDNLGNSLIGTFSKGMRQRLGLGRCLLSDPDLYILDEPLTALDPTGKKGIVEILLNLRDSGKTIFLSSHELRYMDGLCDRILIIKNGKIVSEGTPDAILTTIKGYNEYRFYIRDVQNIIVKILGVFPEIVDHSIRNDLLQLNVKDSIDFEKRFLSYLINNNIQFSLNTHKLDSIYSQIFNEDGHE
jgi:ABC-2 type transport system ATP-binding protein